MLQLVIIGKGSRLQWVNEEEFIYNIYDQKDKSFKSKLFNIYTRSFQVFKLPIQSGFKKNIFYRLIILYLRKIELTTDIVMKLQKEIKSQEFG